MHRPFIKRESIEKKILMHNIKGAADHVSEIEHITAV